MWTMYAFHCRITNTVGRNNCQTDWGRTMTKVVSWGPHIIIIWPFKAYLSALIKPVIYFGDGQCQLLNCCFLSWRCPRYELLLHVFPNIAWLYFCFVSFPLVSRRPIRWATSRWLRSASRQCLIRLLVVSCRTRKWSDSRKIRCKCFGFVFVL